ncbi:MAG TPA: hypothetical protein VF098_10650 [Sphingomicrobium sp.]
MQISTAASAFRARMADRSNFPETCDGGDCGSPSQRSIWLLGLEPGWSVQDQIEDQAGTERSDEEFANYSVELQQTMPFNRNAFKLLAALKGHPPEDYREFACRYRPFERGSGGYFKGNLFPVPCNNLGEWGDQDRRATGFDDKAAYQQWMRATRFPIVASWIAECLPRLIICTGLTHVADYLAVTATPCAPPAHLFQVNGHTKRVHVGSSGLVPVALIPHLSGGPNGLNSVEAIAGAAAYIRRTLTDVDFG